VLAKRGWHQAPNGIESFRKDYYSPLGWCIHVWVEHEDRLEVTPEDTLILVFGPHGTKLGSLWLTKDEALDYVNRLERVLQLDQPYEVVADEVTRFLGGSKVIESEEDFDARSYLMDEFTGLLKSLDYLHVAERSFVKNIHTPQVEFKLYWDGVAEDTRFNSAGQQRHRGQNGGVLVEARHENYQQYATWEPFGQNFHTLLNHAFDHDPPLDVVKQVDDLLTHWTGTIQMAEGELIRLKSKLTDMGEQWFKARKRVESIVDNLLDSEEPFDARQYVLDEPKIETLAEVLAAYYWELTERGGKFGWKFRKLDVDIKDVRCDLSLFVLPEFPFESHLELHTVKVDANGFEHRVRVPQQLWWEQLHETFDEYATRISYDISQEAKV